MRRFAAAFGVRGGPGISPAPADDGDGAAVLENLTDRQAADAVRDRIDWKYALGLELEDPGFDVSVLSEFRSRLVAGDDGAGRWTRCWSGWAGSAWSGPAVRQRTDSTHVLGADPGR